MHFIACHLLHMFQFKIGFIICAGAVDGTLIPIQAPTDNEVAYVCRKNYHALNVQAVCDVDMRYNVFNISFLLVLK